MKNILLLLSLGLNVTIAIFLLAGRSRRATSEIAPSSAAKPGAASSVDSHPNSATAGSAPAEAAANVWATLPLDDLPALAARLRSEGFPKEFIRPIITQEVNELFRDRGKALAIDLSDVPFWQTGPPLTPERLAPLRQLDKERAQMIRDVLGDDATALSPITAAQERYQFGNLPADKLGQVKQIVAEIDQKRSDALSGMTIINSETIKVFDDQRMQALATILTPQEMEEYRLRTSPTSQMLQSRIEAFAPTEAEFRAIFDLQEPFDNKYTLTTATVSNADFMRDRAAADKELSAQIAAALGPERAAEYQRKSDANYVQTNRLVTRLNLPPETTDQMWNMQQDLQQRMTELRTDRSLSPDERTQQLAALADEAKAKGTAALGEQGFEAYKRYGGSWMQNLQPPSPRPAPRPTGP